MNRKFSIRFLIISVLVLFLTATVSDLIHSSNLKYRFEVAKVNRKVIRKEKDASSSLERIANISGDSTGLEREMAGISREDNIIALCYVDGVLDAWSDNSILFPEVYDSTMFDGPLLLIQNRWMIPQKYERDNIICLGLVILRNDYKINNEFIAPGYVEGLGLPDGAGFSLIENVGYPVFNSKDQFLFSLTFNLDDSFVTLLAIIPVFLWILFVLVVASLLNRLAGRLNTRKSSLLPFLMFLITSLIFYSVFLLSDKPAVIQHLDIFSSDRFTLGGLIPSPGHMLVLSILFFYISYGFFKYFPLKEREGNKPFRDFICISLYLVFGAFIFVLFTRVLTKCISLSNINFDIHKIVDLDQFTLVAILSSFLFLVSLGVYLIRIMNTCRQIHGKWILLSGGIALILVSVPFILEGRNPAGEIITFLVILLAARFTSVPKVSRLNMAVLFSLISAAYSSYLLPSETRAREIRNLEVMAVNYCTDNDIFGESLLLDLWEELNSDTLLAELMGIDYFSDEEVIAIYDYLDNRYFTGYWENYDLIYTVCNSNSPLILSDQSDMVNCFGFFNERAQSMGVSLGDSNLVFLNNRSGRAYYLGSLYYETQAGETNGLFIELINQVKYVQTGYPRLLLNEKYFAQPKLEHYSLAKYYSDTLVIQTGIFPFEPIFRYTDKMDREFFTFTDEKTDFLVYNHSSDERMVIARPSILFTDYLITFTYFFVVFFLLYFISGLLVIPAGNLAFSGFDFRRKMQFAFISLLLGSVMAIGAVVIILSIRQYRGNHLDNIQEKLSSVFIELEHKLGQEEQLSPDWSGDGYPTLDALLAKFSNVFYTDINLYSPNGSLLATSRREIFDKELTSTKMNFFAYSRLAKRGASEYIHEEQIAKLKYLSAYTIFSNENNEILAYLNLPYFNMQSRLMEEVSNLVVTIVNFSLVLLVIAMGIAVFISVKITNPLRMLQDGLASVSLGQESKPLEYKGKDEIGELVKQYNTMLHKLHESALKLARTEREDAWREMAKQIAHEIKNPLTPMKLNVQQLYKSWTNKEKDFEKLISRFSESQIEHINSLSSIATEFSNFARMPRANPVNTNLVSHINSACELFKDIRNVIIEINLKGYEEIYINADREQLNSMLTNILRNSVQAIPSNRKGLIKISVELSDIKVLLMINDNGVGIPVDLQDKLFAPNFTTKSSGMGLGLAITKKFVETANGKIWFQSELDAGTTFFVEYPLSNS